MLNTDTSFPFYTDLSGLPLQNGQLYFGVAGQNPITSPVTVYWDAAGTQPAAQPVKTVNGQPCKNGTPARLWISGDYSRLALDSRGRQVLYETNASPLSQGGGAANIGFSQAGAGAVARTAQDKMRERVSVLDFGAVADCTSTGAGTDNIGAFNACIAYANANGFDVYVPPGRYRLSAAVSVSNTGNAGSLYQDFRCSFIGAGPRQSQLWFDNGNFNGLTLNGTLTNAGNPSWQTVSGLALYKYDRQGNGLVLNGHFHAQVENVLCYGWATGHLAQDVHETIYKNFVCMWNNYGAKWQKGTFTQPNIISLYDCTFGNNANYGLDVLNPATFVMVGGSVESNGSGGTDTTKWGVRVIINDAASEGTASALFLGVYMENNVGLNAGAVGAADLWMVNNAQHACLTAVGCSFQRHSNFALNCVRYESAGGFKNKLTLVGCGFRGYSDYTASAGRPYVGIGSPADTIQVSDLGNTFVDATETPDFSYPYVTPQAVSSAWCRFDGTVAGPAITPTQSQNVASVTKNGTGDYTITYKRALAAANNCYDHSIVGANGLLQVFAETTSSVRVRTVNLAGALTDFVLCVGVKGGMNFV